MRATVPTDDLLERIAVAVERLVEARVATSARRAADNSDDRKPCPEPGCRGWVGRRHDGTFWPSCYRCSRGGDAESHASVPDDPF